MYLDGDPLHRGLTMGALQDSLFAKQERVFFAKVKDLVPSESKQKWLRKMLIWYNRDLYLHIPEEYKTELFGLSQYATKEFDFVAPAYLRAMYLHGAHDIGHAMQDLMLVGCSSFAVWGNKSADGKLLIGRNFDFYAGDDFAVDKVISFVKPDKGNAFMSVGWPGMIGAVSGMNNRGLTVTINAGKSAIPLKAKTPISILTREILQYASNIEQAIEIAKKSEVFVSESILVASAEDKKAVIIEMGPKNFGVYQVPNSADHLVCSNHFQSENFADDKRNQQAIQQSHTQYRWNKMQEEIENQPTLTPKLAVDILRNTSAVENGKPLGFGNEKALNQLLAHHGIVFQPEDLKVWVSANPYQLGEFVCYDLKEIFQSDKKLIPEKTLSNTIENIPASAFLQTTEYANYQKFRVQDKILDTFLKHDLAISDDFIDEYLALNHEFWKSYYKVGLYFYAQKDYQRAKTYFEKARTLEITTLPEAEQLENLLAKTKRKLK